jgi:hypothetical protein
MHTEKQDDGEVGRRDFLKKSAAAGVGAGTLAGLSLADLAAQRSAQRRWDLTADFVTIGAGVAGLAAAVSALDHGASVIMVEENFDIGGHGMLSGGNVHLGGGRVDSGSTEYKIPRSRFSRIGSATTTAKAGTAIETWYVPLPTKMLQPLNFWWPTGCNSTTNRLVPVPLRLSPDKGRRCSGPSEAN